MLRLKINIRRLQFEFNHRTVSVHFSYLLPELMGDRGTPQLCLRDVDMDLTRIGKLSRSGSPPKSIVGWSSAPCAVIGFAVSIDRSSPFRSIVKLRSSEVESPLSLTQPASNLGLNCETKWLRGSSSAVCSEEGSDVVMTCRACVVRDVCEGWLMSVFGGTWDPRVCWVLLPGTAVISVDAVVCEASVTPSRSLKYSESLREELRPCRSSTLLLTSTQGQS